MPIWFHILIAALILVSILLGGSVILFITGLLILAVLVPIPLAVLALWLFMKTVPARCPECGGKAYLKRSSEKQFFYECPKCGTVSSTECKYEDN